MFSYGPAKELLEKLSTVPYVSYILNLLYWLLKDYLVDFQESIIVSDTTALVPIWGFIEINIFPLLH